jgi:hypothetical protein
MKSPPIGVKIVMRAICIMLGCVPPLVLAGKVKDEEEIKKVRVVVASNLFIHLPDLCRHATTPML